MPSEWASAFDDWGDNDYENRGRVSRIILKKTNDSGDQQLVDYDGVADESHTEVLRVQTFGFSNHAPPGSEGIMLALNARDAPLVLGAEHPDHKPKDLPEGASQLYDSAGSKVFLDADGNVFVKANGKAVTIDGATKVIINGPAGIELTGPMKFKGDITHEGNMTTTGIHRDANGLHR